MAEKFTLLIRVRYGECDAQQVVFNARYADYADLAATEFVRVVFGGYQKIIEQGMDTQVVNLNLNWQAPARFDDVLAIEVDTAKIGNTSYTLNMNFLRYPQRTPIADCQITYVMVDSREYTKMSIPETFKQTLMEAGKGVLVDQAAAG